MGPVLLYAHYDVQPPLDEHAWRGHRRPSGLCPKHADLLRADAILVCDTGNAAVGVGAVTVSLRGLANVVVGVEALSSEVPGMYAGPAYAALAAAWGGGAP